MQQDAELEARLNFARARSRRPLDDDEEAVVRARIKKALEYRQYLRSVPLENHDEPDLGFPVGAAETVLHEEIAE
jgi:hypothetical protein